MLLKVGMICVFKQKANKKRKFKSIGVCVQFCATAGYVHIVRNILPPPTPL